MSIQKTRTLTQLVRMPCRWRVLFPIKGGSFSDPRVVVMVIVVAIAGLLILMPLSRALANR